jgi:fructokinase
VIHEGVAFDHIEATPERLKAVAAEPVDVFCYGTLEQRAPATRKALYRLLGAVPARIFFYDVNLRQHYYSLQAVQESLMHSTMVKLNETEVGALGALLYGARFPEGRFVERLMAQYPRVRTVCVTKGAAGCAVYWEDRVVACPGVAVNVADTVGAGDAFSAAFLHHYCAGCDPETSAAFANRIGAVVASQRGAVPAYPPEIQALISATEAVS